MAVPDLSPGQFQEGEMVMVFQRREIYGKRAFRFLHGTYCGMSGGRLNFYYNLFYDPNTDSLKFPQVHGDGFSVNNDNELVHCELTVPKEEILGFARESFPNSGQLPDDVSLYEPCINGVLENYDIERTSARLSDIEPGDALMVASMKDYRTLRNARVKIPFEVHSGICEGKDGGKILGLRKDYFLIPEDERFPIHRISPISYHMFKPDRKPQKRYAYGAGIMRRRIVGVKVVKGSKEVLGTGKQILGKQIPKTADF